MAKSKASDADGQRRPSQAEAAWRLACQAGPEKGQAFPLTRMVTVMGRQPTCDIVFTETAISRQHARIERRKGQWVVVNLSQNGTLLNDKKIDHAPLAEGDTIRLGADTVLKVVAEAAEAEVAPAAVTGIRRRRKALKEIQAEEEMPVEEEDAPSESLLKKKKLLIGLGAYFGLMIIFIIIVAYYASNKASGGRVEPMSRADIEDAIDRQMRRPKNPHIAQQKLQEGLLLYDQRRWQEGNLYRAIRTLQESLAYDGRTFFAEREHRDIYEDAVKELTNALWERYTNALLRQRQRRQDAILVFRQIQDMVPRMHNTDNPIYLKANEHLGRLSSR
ncbi:MAG: FHA domain-containing protein [Phycisphaerae bacterium]|nr:FHA domain-containing protein [Phycisphaerae bacterium]